MNKNVPTPKRIPKPPKPPKNQIGDSSPKFKVKSAYDRKKYLRKEIKQLEKENERLKSKIFWLGILLIICFACLLWTFIFMHSKYA